MAKSTPSPKSPVSLVLPGLLAALRKLPTEKRGTCQYVFWAAKGVFTLYRVDGLIGNTIEGTSLKRYFNDTCKDLGLKQVADGTAGYITQGRVDKPATITTFNVTNPVKNGYASVAKGCPDITVDSKADKTLNAAAVAILGLLH